MTEVDSSEGRRSPAAGPARLAAILASSLLLTPLSPSPAGAQDGSCLTPRLLPTAAAESGQAGCVPRPDPTPGPVSRAERTTGPGRAFASSLLLPGTGQWLQGQERSYLYLGLELAGWAVFLHGRSRGAGLRDRYRDLAWEVARLTTDGPREEGDFRYYEALAQYPASGAWDADPARSGIQPETDPGTHNGAVWSLAREIYSVDESADADSPAYDRALEYYRERSYGPDLAWDWSDAPDSAQRYRRLIDRSDAAFRRATIVLGAIATNHLLSAVDGFLSARIATARSRQTVAPSASPLAARPFERWSLELRIRTP